MELRWCNVDFEVRRGAQGERHLIVPWHCVDIFVILSSSRSAVLLSPSMVGINDYEGTRSLLVPNQPGLAYYSGLVFN